MHVFSFVCSIVKPISLWHGINSNLYSRTKLLISRMRHYFNTMIKIVSQLTGVKIMILLLLNFKRVTSHLTMGLTSHYIMM